MDKTERPEWETLLENDIKEFLIKSKQKRKELREFIKHKVEESKTNNKERKHPFEERD